MAQTRPPQAVILEEDPGTAQAAETALALDGWSVVLAEDAEAVFVCLGQDPSSPCALVACGLGRDRTPDGSSLLESVRQVSPVTQRMLWLPESDPRALVEAVNLARISACMTYPLDPEGLRQQAAACLNQFRADL